MNREQRRAEQKAGTQKTSPSLEQTTASLLLRSFILWAVGILVAFGVLFGLWSVSTASSVAAKERTFSPILPALVSAAPFSSTPAFGNPVSAAPAAPFIGKARVVKAGDLKKGDTVWQNGQWLTIASIERKTTKATPLPAPSVKPVLEADLEFDLSEFNGGRTFDVGRIAPCSQSVVFANGRRATVGDLKVGDKIRMTGDNVGRVVSIAKNWHKPTPSKSDEKGNSSHRVIANTKRMTDQLLYLYTTEELVKTTPEHLFAVKGKGYVEAGKLQSGDVLETQDNRVVTVKRTEVRNESQLVYNLEGWFNTPKAYYFNL